MDIPKYLAMHIVGGGLLLFMGCAAQQPAISDIRDDMVKGQGEPLLDNLFGFSHVREKNEETLQVVRVEVERGCQIYERGVSNMLSARCVEFGQRLARGLCVRSEYLFACTKD